MFKYWRTCFFFAVAERTIWFCCFLSVSRTEKNDEIVINSYLIRKSTSTLNVHKAAVMSANWWGLSLEEMIWRKYVFFLLFHDRLRASSVLYAIIHILFGGFWFFGYFTSTNYVIRQWSRWNSSTQNNEHEIRVQQKKRRNKISCYSTRSFSNSIKLNARRKCGRNPQTEFSLFLLRLIFRCFFFVCAPTFWVNSVFVCFLVCVCIFVCFELRSEMLEDVDLSAGQIDRQFCLFQCVWTMRVPVQFYNVTSLALTQPPIYEFQVKHKI